MTFEKALTCLKEGKVIGITINDKKRRYYLNQFGNIICIPNDKEYLAYQIKSFHVDAIMSNEWKNLSEDI